jgi:hypothetical protein
MSDGRSPADACQIEDWFPDPLLSPIVRIRIEEMILRDRDSRRSGNGERRWQQSREGCGRDRRG